MQFSTLTLITLLTALAQADIKLPDPKNPSSGNFGFWKVDNYHEACVGAMCQHGVSDGDFIFGGSIADACTSGQSFPANDNSGHPALNSQGLLKFDKGICGSKPMNCQQSGSQWTCKYDAGDKVAARCVDVDRSNGITKKVCHGSNPFKDTDVYSLDVICNDDGSFHC